MSVKVAVRVRPFNQREIELKRNQIVIEMEGNKTIIKHLEKGSKKDFAFDYSFWSHDGFEILDNGYNKAIDSRYSDQQSVYEKVGKEVLENAWQGYNCCLFAYGQTGSGKSYSMIGYGTNKGIVPISCEQIFERQKIDSEGKEYELNFSMLEIYNEKLQDLLIKPDTRPKGGLKIREHKQFGVYVENLSQHKVNSYKEIDQKMDIGNTNRTIGSTLMNQSSSRAHTVISIHLKIKENNLMKQSVINLVDLAGSEKTAKTGATGDRLKEGCSINKSLSTLGKVISVLADNQTSKKKDQKVVPFRDSALTRLLSNALGGNSKTLMICALSPSWDNYDETLSTLRYADQAKKIKCNAVVNESEQEKMIRSLKEENDQLKNMLQSFMKDPSKINLDTLARIQEDLESNACLIQHVAQNEEQEEEKPVRRESTKQEDQETNIRMLVNLNEDSMLNGKLKYTLNKQINKIGSRNNPNNNIQIGGLEIKDEHGYIEIGDDGNCYVVAQEGKIWVNGKLIQKEVFSNEDRVIFGKSTSFIFKDVEHEVNLVMDWEQAQQEVIKNSSPKQSGNVSPQKKQSIDDVSEDKISNFQEEQDDNEFQHKSQKKKTMVKLDRYNQKVAHANQIASILKKRVELKIKVQYKFENSESYDIYEEYSEFNDFNIIVEVYNYEYGYIYRWNNKKFKNRYFLMSDLLDQKQEQDQEDMITMLDKYDDPYWDPPEHIQLGECYLQLMNLAYHIPHNFDLQILNEELSDSPIGSLQVQTIPQISEYEPVKSHLADPYSMVGPFGFGVDFQSISISKNYMLEDIYLSYKWDGVEYQTVKIDLDSDNRYVNESQSTMVWTQINEIDENLVDYLLQKQLCIQVLGVVRIPKVKNMRKSTIQDQFHEQKIKEMTQKETNSKSSDGCNIF